MELTTRSARSARWAAAAPRTIGLVLVGVLAAAGLRVIVAGPPAAPPARVVRAQEPTSDPAIEAFAQAFAREYLTWRPNHAEVRAARLRPYLGTGLDEDGGLSPVSDTSQRVEWTAIGGAHPDGSGVTVLVVAGTSNGLVHLSVPVARDARGFVTVAGYPALLGPPPTDPQAALQPPGASVEDADLLAVVERALTNYLAGERENLLADLTPDAVVSLPDRHLRVTDVRNVTWLRENRVVAVELEARDAHHTTWTLRYELSVQRSDRWYVRSLDPDPSTGGARP
ncbi:MAG TPA: conjugal transfer protein [Conexibacter sp.]|nr:conjugal transfer protein [Conexibacter sp.]